MFLSGSTNVNKQRDFYYYYYYFYYQYGSNKVYISSWSLSEGIITTTTMTKFYMLNCKYYSRRDVDVNLTSTTTSITSTATMGAT